MPRTKIVKLLGLLRSPSGKDVYNTALTQLWRLVSGPLSMFFIPLFLTEKSQGVWYTFISLSALAVFADLGFTSIVMQFSAHEYAFLSTNNNGVLCGDEDHLRRISSLFRYVVKWASRAALIAFPVIFLAGAVMFENKKVDVPWAIPWGIYVAFSGLGFINNFVLSFVQGCNQVSGVQRISFFSSVVTTLSMLLFLYIRTGLYALIISLIVNVVFTEILIVLKYRHMLLELWNRSRQTRYLWAKEILRLFWRYALSFGSGYFIFQLYTPIAFQFHGVVAAGKVGISIALWTAVWSISNVWISSVIPRMNMLIATKRWADLDRTFLKRLLLSLFTYVLGFVALVVIYKAFHGKFVVVEKVAGRFADSRSMIFLAIGWFLQIVINSMATYLRAHKEEPYVWLSVSGGVYLAIATLLCAKFLPSNMLFLGFLSSYFWGLPLSSLVFARKRREWHTR